MYAGEGGIEGSRCVPIMSYLLADCLNNLNANTVWKPESTVRQIRDCQLATSPDFPVEEGVSSFMLSTTIVLGLQNLISTFLRLKASKQASEDIKEH